MPRLQLSAVVLLLAAGPVAAQAPRYKIEAADRQTVAAAITYELRTTDFVVTRWTAFLPEPPELPSQRRVKTAAAPAGKLVAENSLLGRKVRLIDVPVADPQPGAKLALRLDVTATLRSRKLVPLRPGEAPPAVPALTPQEGKHYLAPSPQIDYEKEAVQGWLDAKGLRREKGEDPVAFATRAVGAIWAAFAYKYDPGDDEKRASVACTRQTADCAGMSYLLVAALRANNVPARVLVGRLAEPRKPKVGPADPGYDRPHVRAEFYLAGVGWVPADPVDNVVGDDPGDLLVLHADTDLRLPFPDKERTARLLQVGPYYWANGRGRFDGAEGPTGWEVKTAPVKRK
ncbi:MAG: transglutaminase family protein [Gemmataceae bacterium]|nr:transglutaminase family protein [Gemmataceae bacterium]